MRSKSVTAAPEIEALIALLTKVPGLGPRSARRAALQLLKKKDALMLPLAAALSDAAAKVGACSNCGALDTQDPCALCSAPDRDDGVICVVADVGDVWALERAGAFKGRYHVLGGVLSALDGVRPEDFAVFERERIERPHEFLRRHDERRRDMCPAPTAGELRARLQVLCAQAADQRQARQRRILMPLDLLPVCNDGEKASAEDVPEITDERVG